MARSKPEKIIINNINVRPVNRKNLDIQKWRSALIAAEGMAKNRSTLYDIYEDVILDAHLKSITDKRINSVVNLELKFFDQNNEESEEINKLINTIAFETLLKELIKAKLYGFSLVQVDWSPSEGYQNKTYTVDRRHVKPEFGIVVANPVEITGLDYTSHPFAIFAGDGDFGLLLQACPMVIYKRNNVADWADFNELFGKPYPQGSYTNDDTAAILTEAFEKAGFKAFMVAPKDAEIDLHQGSSATGTSGLFASLREAMNDELSVLILGQNLTTKVDDKGSYAASKTHSQVEESIHTTDREFIIRTLNEKLVPVLEKSGFKARGQFRFVYSDDVPLEKRIIIDTQLANLIPVDSDYFYETYSVPRPQKGADVKKPEIKSEKKEKEQDSLSFGERLSRFFFRKKQVLRF